MVVDLFCMREVTASEVGLVETNVSKVCVRKIAAADVGLDERTAVKVCKRKLQPATFAFVKLGTVVGILHF
jgi:hypothetical protein